MYYTSSAGPGSGSGRADKFHFDAQRGHRVFRPVDSRGSQKTEDSVPEGGTGTPKRIW